VRIVSCPECGSATVLAIARALDRWPNPTVDRCEFECEECGLRWERDYLAPPVKR
jgi:transposase